MGCCGVVVAQWSERRQLRSEALGSIPSGYPCIFSRFYPDLPPVAYHQLLLISIVTKIRPHQHEFVCLFIHFRIQSSAAGVMLLMQSLDVHLLPIKCLPAKELNV